MYNNESTPPPPHTHTQTLGIHVRLSAPGFGAHHICAFTDPVFHFFFVCLFHRGAHMLRSLTSFFFSNGKLINYRPVLILIAL